MAIIIAHKSLATALTTASSSAKVSPPLEIATRLTVAGKCGKPKKLKVGDFSSLPVAGQKITLTTCFDATLNGTVLRIIQLNNPMAQRCG